MKTTFFKINAFVLLFSLMGTGCKDSDDSIEYQLNQIDFKIVTMDKNQTEKSVFDVGEDVVLAFKAINNSGKAIELKLKSNYLTCKIFQNEINFLFVNKKSDKYNVCSHW